MSEPVRLGQILLAVMKNIENRMEEGAGMNDTKNQNQRSRRRSKAMATERWQFNRQINVSVLIQLVFLASLIVGSWVNLQRQLDLLQRDVTSLLENQRRSAEKVEALQEKVISHEFRLKQLEKESQE